MTVLNEWWKTESVPEIQYHNDRTLKLRKVYIEPTSECNLQCSICFRHGWFEEVLGQMELGTFEKLAQELGQLSCVEEVFFGGMGEPLFHPDICSMIKLLPPTVKVSLLTNGTMLTGACAKALIQAGLSELWISMDGFEKACYEAIRLGSRFDLLCRNLEAFNEARKDKDVKLGITFVVTKENVEQLNHINAFADAIKADMLNISHQIPGEPLKKEEMLYHRTDIPVGKMKRFAWKAQEAAENCCPFIDGQCTFVRWDGKVIPCMQLLHNCYTWLYEEKRKITGFSYGNISEKTLWECWKDKKYVDFRERVSSFSFPFCRECPGCDDRLENLTDCIYGDGPACGACLWATGKIRCP